MRARPNVAATVALVLLALAGCSPPGGLRDESPKEPGEKETVAGPRTDSFPRVLSEEAADSGRALTVAEMQAELAADPGSPPEGYRRYSVVVSEGLGSFQIAAPDRYSAPWRYGTPFDELLQQGRSRDPGWSEFWSTRLDDDENPRAVLLDSENEDAVVAILVTITDAPSEEGDDMAEFFSEAYSEIGEVTEAHGVVVNGGEGAYVEYAVPADMVDGDEDRIQLQVLVPDKPNNVLWGVTCDVPRSLLAEIKEECADIAATFRPLPVIQG